LFVVTAILMGMFGLVMAFTAMQWWRQKDGRNSERVMLLAISLITLVYAASTGILAS
jgi:hypothetical protein